MAYEYFTQGGYVESELVFAVTPNAEPATLASHQLFTNFTPLHTFFYTPKSPYRVKHFPPRFLLELFMQLMC